MTMTDEVAAVATVPAKSPRKYVEKRQRSNPVERLFRKIEGWVSANREKVKDVFLATGDGLLTLYVVTEAEEHDFDLSGSLLDMAAPLVARGMIASAMLVGNSSEEELGSLFSVGTAIDVIASLRSLRHA